MDQGGSRGGCKNQLKSAYILQVKLTRFTSRLCVWYEREETDDSKVFPLIIKLAKIVGRADFGWKWQRFSFMHVNFEMSVRHPSRGVGWTGI